MAISFTKINLDNDEIEGVSVFDVNNNSAEDIVCEGFWHEGDNDYVVINEDMSMKTGLLLSPFQYKEFTMPHM